MLNKKDIPRLEEKIKSLIKKEGTDEAISVENFLSEIASPSTGLIYKPGVNGAPGHLQIAEGWIADDNGNIVELDNVSNPGTGKVYHNGN